METMQIFGSEEDESIKKIRSVLGDLSKPAILRALALAGNDIDEAISILRYRLGSVTPLETAMKTTTSTGSRVSTVRVKEEISEVVVEDDLNNDLKKPKIEINEESTMGFDKKMVLVKEEQKELELDQSLTLVREKEFCSMDIDNKEVLVKKEPKELKLNRCQALVPVNEPTHMLSNDYDIVTIDSINNGSSPFYHPSKPVNVMEKKENEQIDDGEFPEEVDWLLVGRSTVVGLSTCKRKKLDFNEIVYFTYPSSAKTKIVRFSTKRSGEVCHETLIFLSTFFKHISRFQIFIKC